MLTQNREISRSLGTAYRNFSRKRYEQIKQQNQYLRESDIVGKVIKEWEAMNQKQKAIFAEDKNDAMVMLNIEPLATPRKDALGKSHQKSTSMKEEHDMKMENV